MDLSGTKLVVLSACDTGVGDILPGDGVSGLRRAFALAGAETIVMSLWQVSDTSTRDLMTSFYSKLKTGIGRGEALRQAQLEIINSDDKSANMESRELVREGRTNSQNRGHVHPYYWAAFIQSGDWRGIELK